MKFCKIFSLGFALNFTLAPLASAQRAQEASDAILDRLERKLIEQEANTLRLQTPAPKEKSKQISMPASSLGTITASPPEQKDFAALDQQLLSIEQDIDDLSGQVEKLKADFQNKSNKGTLVEIMVELDAPLETSLRDLHFGINDHKIYTRSGQNAWTPGAQILLYSGPLEPGEHTLKLEARTVRRYGEGLPLDQNLYHQYEQTFKVALPQGNFRKGYRIKLAKPEQQNIHAKAVFENYDIP